MKKEKNKKSGFLKYAGNEILKLHLIVMTGWNLSRGQNIFKRIYKFIVRGYKVYFYFLKDGYVGFPEKRVR